MTRGRRLLVVAACALPLSQVGHALVTAAGGPASAEIHSYFAADLAASVAVLLAAAAGSGSLLVAAYRRSGALRARRRAAWPLLWTFLGLAALQLELYLAQELLEGGRGADVAWTGLAGQLPVAAIGALALWWLSSRLGPAVRELERPTLAPAAAAAIPSAWCDEMVSPVAGTRVEAGRPRGPPAFLLA